MLLRHTTSERYVLPILRDGITPPVEIGQVVHCLIKIMFTLLQ